MNKRQHYDVIIIGGGAGGLATAVMGKQKENTILVIEHNDRTGKKLLSTGNGKCNLTNNFARVEDGAFASNPEGVLPYCSSGDLSFAKEVLSSFDAQQAKAFFQDLGMLLLDKNGYIYPRSEQASAVGELLRLQAENRGVDFLCGYQPMKITKKDCFLIDDYYSCDKLVLATGGMNAPKTGSDGSGYALAAAFGHRMITPVPALCALECSDSFLKDLQGIRTDALLSLYDLGTDVTDQTKAEKALSRSKAGPILQVFGNLQLNKTAISGIPVFQLSLTASRLLQEGHSLLVKINFLPELTEEELAKKINPQNPAWYLGIVNQKLAKVIAKESYLAHPNETEEEYPHVFAHMLQRFKVHPVAAASFTEAQTTLGGVSVQEIDAHTMQSKVVPGLYFAGEIVDVSGICGGYNLQWAWASAHQAANAIKNK